MQGQKTRRHNKNKEVKNMGEKQISLDGFPTTKEQFAPRTFDGPIIKVFGSETDGSDGRAIQRKINIVVKPPWNKDINDEETLRTIRFATEELRDGKWIKKGQSSPACKFLDALSNVAIEGSKEKGVKLKAGWLGLVGHVFRWEDITMEFGVNRTNGENMSKKMTIPIMYLGKAEDWSKRQK
jgi:hypothetical protein